MAHVKTSYGFWYPQNVSAGGDKVDAQKMFVDNIKLLNAMLQKTIMQRNSVSISDLDTIFDYGMYPITGSNMVVSTANNIQIKYAADGTMVRIYNGSAWSEWSSGYDSEISNSISNISTIANNAYNRANGAYNQANNAYNQANNVFNYANNAYNRANSAYNHANGAYNQANNVYNRTNNAYNQANGAFDQANSAYNQANNAYNRTNSAYNQANNAYNQANNAYNLANNIISNPILIAQNNVPTSVPAGTFIGVWEE